MAEGTFGTAINCIDGRVQAPVAEWVRARFGVQYVDTVTAPGPDGVLTQGTPPAIALIRDYARVSQEAHHSGVVAIAGHFGCAGYPVPPDEHKTAIRAAAAIVASWGMPMRVIGLWVNEGGQIEVVSDSATG
ncbi:MAG TPA: carbonic anhydrase [Ktedonobacterales bacterium]